MKFDVDLARGRAPGPPHSGCNLRNRALDQLGKHHIVTRNTEDIPSPWIAAHRTWPNLVAARRRGACVQSGSLAALGFGQGLWKDRAPLLLEPGPALGFPRSLTCSRRRKSVDAKAGPTAQSLNVSSRAIPLLLA